MNGSIVIETPIKHIGSHTVKLVLPARAKVMYDHRRSRIICISMADYKQLVVAFLATVLLSVDLPRSSLGRTARWSVSRPQTFSQKMYKFRSLQTTDETDGVNTEYPYQ